MQKNLLSCDFVPLSIAWRCFYLIAGFILVAFGQPAWISTIGLLAACIGYALFWRVLLCISVPSQRFWFAFAWLFSVQLIQLSWFISHPYLYIYAVYFFLAALFGVQFGVIGLLINSRMISSVWRMIAIAALWTVFEWSRLFILSGFSFNFVGNALGGNLYSLQMASLWGVLGLSFWIFFTNLLALRAWQTRRFSCLILWLVIALAPYIFGVVQLYVHETGMAKQEKPTFNAILVQTAFPVEETIRFTSRSNMIDYVSEEWRKILTIMKQYLGKPIDLIALPEFVVPFGTYANVYNYDSVKNIIHEVLGQESAKKLPSPKWPLGDFIKPSEEEQRQLMVNNAFWVQSLANLFDAAVIAGLEDAEDKPNQEREYYSAALFFQPETKAIPLSQEAIRTNQPMQDSQYYCERYEKRVLVPMGEYIPFAFCRELAKQYGVFGSFTAGTEAKLMQCGSVKISPSICYEETYGDLVSESKQKGAEMLVNLTSDVWYPNSLLPVQHFEHARFRTVETGLPLIRACNTGVTAAIDSLGRSVGVLGGDSPEKVEWVSDALYVNVPTYTYPTLYSQFGDKLIIGFSLLVILISALFRQFSF